MAEQNEAFEFDIRNQNYENLLNSLWWISKAIQEKLIRVQLLKTRCMSPQ